MKNTKKALALIAAAALSIGAISACSNTSDNANSNTSISAEENQAIGPVIIEVSELNGTIETTVERMVVVNVDSDFDKWQGSATDSTVVEFVPGIAGTSNHNPGFAPLKAGTTDVTMTAPDGTEYSFTIVVKAE